MKNLDKYCSNICDIIYDTMFEPWYNAKEVDIHDDFDFKNGVITFGVTTMTCCADPKVNYYDDGSKSVYNFIEELKEKIQISNINYIEDWDCDECGSITQSGYIIIKIKG